MDILAHTLWANAAARGANAALKKKKKLVRIHPGWTGFWGVFPDFFAFAIPFIENIYRLITGRAANIWEHHSGFSIAANLYQYSHSIVIWAAVFVIVWIFFKRPRYELLGWALHILIDIPSHAITFYPTPFLFPISEYRFPYGVPWSNKWYMIINYSLLAIVWSGIIIRKMRQKHLLEIKNKPQ